MSQTFAIIEPQNYILIRLTQFSEDCKKSQQENSSPLTNALCPEGAPESRLRREKYSGCFGEGYGYEARFV